VPFGPAVERRVTNTTKCGKLRDKLFRTPITTDHHGPRVGTSLTDSRDDKKLSSVRCLLKSCCGLAERFDAELAEELQEAQGALFLLRHLKKGSNTTNRPINRSGQRCTFICTTQKFNLMLTIS
jgi:hypothetical protein